MGSGCWVMHLRIMTRTVSSMRHHSSGRIVGSVAAKARLRRKQKVIQKIPKPYPAHAALGLRVAVDGTLP